MRPFLYALPLLTTQIALATEPAALPPLEVMWMGGSAPEGTHVLPASAAKVSASSELCEGKGARRVCHTADRLVDGKNDTAWCEGAAKDGVSQSVTFEFKSPQELVALDVVPYYAKDMRRAMGNARPHRVLLEVGAQRFELTLPDHPARVAKENLPEGRTTEGDPCGDESCGTQDERIATGEHYRVTLPAPVKAQKLRLELLSTHGGNKHPDTCMSAVTLHVR